MHDEYFKYRSDRIIQSTIGRAISHLIKNLTWFKLSEEQICILAIALFIINKLPRILKNPPDIFIELYLPEFVGFNAFNLRLEGHMLVIGCGGYDQNDFGGDSYSKNIADINLLEFNELVLVEEFEELNNWADAFVKANGEFQLTIESNITSYNEKDLYDPGFDIEDDIGGDD